MSARAAEVAGATPPSPVRAAPPGDPTALVRTRTLSARERSAHAQLTEALFATNAAGETDVWGRGVARAATVLLEADSAVLVLGPVQGRRMRADGRSHRAMSCDWMGPLAAARVWTCEEPSGSGAAGLTVDIEPNRVRAELSCRWRVPRDPSLTRARALLDLMAPAMVGALRMRVLVAGSSARSTQTGTFASSETPSGARIVSAAREPRRGREAARARPVDDASLQARFGLTDREAEITHFLVQGQSNAEIATRLGIRPATARHHTEHIMSKLGVHSRAGVTAVVYGLVSAPVHRSLHAARRSNVG